MQLLCDTSDFTGRPSVATIGFFDGVHRGHRYLIEQVRQVAAMRGLASSVITFPVHPQKVMQPDSRPELLTTCDEKVSLLAQLEIDYCIMIDFSPELARLSARQFMSILKEHYRVQALVVGYDHRFGHNRSEGFDDYVRYGRELGIEVLRARAYSYKKTAVEKSKETALENTAAEETNVVGGGGVGCTAMTAEETVSSSVIRQLVLGGSVMAAAEYLGYDFFLNGTVVGGYRVGRTIGFPTANLRVDDPDKIIPADGVYAVRVLVAGVEYGGMLSIGYRPTLGNGSDRSIEVHIFHFDADVYEQTMRVSFVRRTRPELKFDSIDELIEQLHRDEIEIKAILS
ncbi:bifunctional riboflavin kinase/FMN adenylyltransferase [Bacteroides zoogleoformans]|uniref:bifunctional riboflavin kinase/FMN adenylyltransferase n=1 Tax=Bacteroides zoogleoformans TaxID=28119 RepID=UPI00248E163A|nr:bifunctional riboflavin kinase/FMN adenylyltransferase [Bacteroides zoogleoformans]